MRFRMLLAVLMCAIVARVSAQRPLFDGFPVNPPAQWTEGNVPLPPGVTMIVAAGGGRIQIIDERGQVIDTLAPYGDDYRGDVNFATGTTGGSNPRTILLAGPGRTAELPVVAFQLNPSPQSLGDLGLFPDAGSGVEIAMGNVTGDSADEIFVTRQSGGPGTIHLMSLTRADVFPLQAFPPGTPGETHLITGDFNGNGHDELVASANGEVHVWEFLSESEPREIGHGFPFTSPSGGVLVGAVDFNRDGGDDLVTVTASTTPRARVWNLITPTPTLLIDSVLDQIEPDIPVRVTAGRVNNKPSLLLTGMQVLHRYAFDPFDQKFADEVPLATAIAILTDIKLIELR